MSQELGKIFKAVADPSRRKILEMLREKELSAGEIAAAFKMSKPAISNHLALLKEAGLASERREGQKIIYSLNEDSFLAAWDEFWAKFCGHKRRQVTRRKSQKATGGA